MPIRLSIWLSQRSDLAHTFEFDAGEIAVGRGQACHVRLPFHFVSSLHFTIVAEGTAYLIADNGSTNGTVVNGKRLAPNAYTPLRSNDIVSVGEIMVQAAIIEQTTNTFSLEASCEEVRSMVLESLAAKGPAQRAALEVVQGPDAGKTLDIEALQRVVIGSAQESQLTLTEPECKPEHLALRRAQYGFEALPLDNQLSKVNQRPLVDTMALGSEAAIQIGGTLIRFVDPLQRYLDDLARLPDESQDAPAQARDDVLSTQQIDDVHYTEIGEAPHELGPPDRPPAPGQLKLVTEVEASGFHKRLPTQGWGAFEYLIVAVTGLLVFGGLVAVLVLLGVIQI